MENQEEALLLCLSSLLLHLSSSFPPFCKAALLPPDPHTTWKWALPLPLSVLVIPDRQQQSTGDSDPTPARLERASDPGWAVPVAAEGRQGSQHRNAALAPMGAPPTPAFLKQLRWRAAGWYHGGKPF